LRLLGNPIETCIERIYRPEPGAPSELAGTVEKPGSSGMKSFAGIDELWSIFTGGSSSTQKEKRKGADRPVRSFDQTDERSR